MAVIEAVGLGKRYGDRAAVINLSFRVDPGSVTGFLGPNGSGKSTTMRLMLGLDNGDGRTTFDGQEFRALRNPMRSVGALLEAKAFHPTRKARNHLRLLAAGLVILMIGATAATVVLASRASLDTHRGTIEVLHLMGATDAQVARLFQRRIALDAAFGGAVGLIAAALVLLLIGDRVGALGSELIGSAGLPLSSWLILIALPIAGVFLAMLVARNTILRALGKLL